MALCSEAIQLAEASDWGALQHLMDRSPECAQEVGEYGMLPVHWACTESHVPVALLDQLLAAYRDGARKKNDAGLLPLHIAIRARTNAAWLESLLAVYPGAVLEDTPDGVSVLALADQVGLDSDAVQVLRKTHYALQCSRGNAIHVDRGADHPEEEDLATISIVNPQVLKLRADNQSFDSNDSKTPGSAIDSLASYDSESESPQTPREQLVSPSSNSSGSTCSVNTAPLPTSAVHPQIRLLKQTERKHSLDYHTHAAAAAAAARQFQETLMRGDLLYASASQRTAAAPQSAPTAHAAPRGRHQSLPIIPNFEHIPFSAPPMQPSSEQSSEDEERRASPSPHGASDFELPPEWKRDDACSICLVSFGMFKHRHHCRNCGKSICNQHSATKKLLMESKGFTTPQRVCIACYAAHVQRRSSASQNAGDVDLLGERTPVASFYRNQQHSVASSSKRGTTPSDSSMNSPVNARPATATSQPELTSSFAPGSNPARKSFVGSEHQSASMQSRLNELKYQVVHQQRQIEQLGRDKMQLQKQVLEQEELQAETMLLVTQLMTRVSVLETATNQQDHGTH